MLLAVLQSLQGYGVTLQQRDGRLFIQSATVVLNDHQSAILRTYKPLLLALLPDAVVCPIGLLVDALEVHEERLGIMTESGDVPESVMQEIAIEQAKLVLEVSLTSPVPPSATLRETPTANNLSGL